MWAIQHINEIKSDQRILFITPFLSECKRIKAECSSKGFVSPDVRSGRGRKMNSLIQLIRSGKNIVSTHALFSNLDEELMTELKKKKYTLIVDEAMEILKKVNIYDDLDSEEGEAKTYADLKTLVSKDIIRVSESGEVSWSDDAILDKYKYIEVKSKLNSLIMIDDMVLMWTFPYTIFKDNLFEDIYILTYQFDYQLQYYYFKYYDIEYTKKEVIKNDSGRKYELVAFGKLNLDIEFRKGIKSLIEICDSEKLNTIGSRSIYSSQQTFGIALSLSWYKKNEDQIKIVRKNMINYFKNISSSSGKERMWSSFKDYQNQLKGDGVSNKNFIAINARATNDFANRKYLAYVVNRYLNPCFSHFFTQQGIYLDQDKFALSELIQWIWRSAIRNGEKIYIYIPSERMRNLLIEWLDI
jgi:hypothetical protein